MAQGPGTQRSFDTAYAQTQAGRPDLAPAATQGVLGRRVIAYLVDLVVLFFLASLLCVAIAIIGLLTFGLGWALFSLVPLTAIAYNAFTIGGPAQATYGMRAVGLRVVDALTGGPVPKLTAAVHALLFYVAAGTFVLWAIDVIVGMMRDDRRLGHDLLTGVTLVRAS